MRIKEFQEWLKGKNIDFALLLNNYKQDPNLFYLTQLDLEFACLIIPKNKKPLLIVSSFEKERVKKYGKIKNVIGKKKGRLFEYIKHRLNRAKKIGINKNVFSVNEYKALKKYFKKCRFIDISQELTNLRQIKTKEEILLIKKSASIASKITEKCILNIKKLKTEIAVKDFLEVETKKNGCEIAFPPIVASGSNAAMPHHAPQNIPLKKGFCVIDFGVKHRGYCSDLTRTVYIGKPSKKELELYNFLLDIQQNTIKEIKINKKTSDLYNKVVKDLGKFKKYFTHGLGHGIGIEVHENPNLTPGSKDKIKQGMAFTVEPGIYIKNRIGIRIEDDILVGKNSVEVLTKTKKNLIIIK